MDQKTLENNIRQCLFLAKLGTGHVSPNPAVGALLVYNDQIIGQGYHRKFGDAHAEVNAISDVANHHKHLIAESTLFVSLEPCMIHGKTAPCTDFILKNKIKKLVFGCYDPNPLMSGKSIQLLQEQGVEVTGPVMESECQKCIREFKVNITLNRPYVILKFAQSADFFLGIKNQRTKISNQYSDILVHCWRSEVDAILIGRNTVEIDNPKLTNRLWPGKNPVRLVLSSCTFNKNDNYHIMNNDAITWLKTDVIGLNTFTLENYLHELYKKQIGIILVEGGAKTIQSFYDSDLWDEARIITATSVHLNEGIRAPSIKGKREKTMILDKNLIHYIIKNQA